MHIPFSYLKKIEKTVQSDKQEPQKCGSTKCGVRAFYHMIRGLPSTLSCDKTLLINFFLFYSFFQDNLPGLLGILQFSGSFNLA